MKLGVARPMTDADRMALVDKTPWLRIWGEESTWSRGDAGNLIVTLAEADLERLLRISKMSKVKVVVDPSPAAGRIVCQLSGKHEAVVVIAAWVLNGLGRN